MPVVSDYTALLAINDSENSRWNAQNTLGAPVIVTYSFADGDNVPLPSEVAYTVSGTSAFTLQQRVNFRLATEVFEAASGIVFVEIEEGGMIDVFNVSGSSYGGWASYPWVSEYSTSTGNLAIDNSGDYAPGSWAFGTMLHELGHGTGLQHPHTGSVTLNTAYDNQTYTMMTYNNSGGRNTDLGIFDKQALKYLYGDVVDTSGWTMAYDNTALVFNLTASSRAETILGVAGMNNLKGGRGGDTMYGRDDNDIISGQGGQDFLVGMKGEDTLFGGAKADTLFGDLEDETAYSGGGDKLYGGKGADVLYGGTGLDTLRGGDQADVLNGGTYGDLLYGNKGGDTLLGDSGNDTQYGGEGSDLLYGGEGYDTLYGGAGKDQLFGGIYNDVLYGGRGGDVLTGGTGSDWFVFTNSSGRDRITDFGDYGDKIDLRATSFGFSDLKFRSRNDGADTLITVAGSDVRIYLEDVIKADLTSSDFYY